MPELGLQKSKLEIPQSPPAPPPCLAPCPGGGVVAVCAVFGALHGFLLLCPRQLGLPDTDATAMLERMQREVTGCGVWWWWWWWQHGSSRASESAVISAPACLTGLSDRSV